MGIAFNRAVAVELTRPYRTDPFDIGELDDEIRDLKVEMSSHEAHLLYLLKCGLERAKTGIQPNYPKVYFAQSDDGQVKIGYTATSLKARTAALQNGNPHKIEMKAAIHGARQSLERRLHKQFSASRLKGEWFSPTPELLKIMADHPPSDTPPATPCECDLCQAMRATVDLLPLADEIPF